MPSAPHVGQAEAEAHGSDAASAHGLRREADADPLEAVPAFLSRNAIPTTDTELRLIASAAIIGESSQPSRVHATRDGEIAVFDDVMLAADAIVGAQRDGGRA